MARKTWHLSESVVTIGNIALGNRSLNLLCFDCGHEANWSPPELAAVEPPGRRLWDFKRRRCCSNCGTRGSTDRVYLTCHNVYSGSSEYRPPDPTPPQLWPS